MDGIDVTPSASIGAVDPSHAIAGGSPETAAPIKRGRGRPRKDGSGPATVGTGRTTKASATKAKAQVDLTGIEKILLSMHGMLAVYTKVPEFALSQPEAAALATGIQDVASHYPVDAGPEALAWTNLAMTAAMVYGPRFLAYQERLKKARQ